MSNEVLPQALPTPIFRRSNADIMRAEDARVGSTLATLSRRILLAIVLLETSLQIDTFLYHDAATAEYGAISGFNVSVTTVCLLLLYVQWLPRTLVESRPIKFSTMLVLYFAIAALTAFWAFDQSRAVYELFLVGQAVLLFFYLVNHLETRSDLVFVIGLLAVGLLVQGMMMIAAKFLVDDIVVGPWEFHYHSQTHRVSGSFDSPNVASSYIAMLLAPSLSLFLARDPKVLRLLALAALLVGSAGLVLTMSRGGWLAATVSIVVFVLVAHRKRWLSYWFLATFVLSGLVLAAVLSPVLIDRLLGDDRGSAAARIPLNEITQTIIYENPMGVGVNNWDVAASPLAMQTDYREAWYYTVHNRYLLVCAEIGWLGLFAYIGFLLSIVVLGSRTVVQGNSDVALLTLGLLAAFIGQIVHMFFEVFNSRTQIYMIVLIAALIFAAAHLRNEQPTQKDQTAVAP